MSDYTTDGQRVSYGLGHQMGQQMMENPFDGLEVSAVITGLQDAINSIDCPIKDEDMRAAFAAINEQMQAKQAEEAKSKSAEGDKFLTDNAARDEVTTTESGLQYEVLTTGEGEIPTAAATVRTHYHGTLIDGTVFDSSYDRGEPTEFPVGGVIAGWTEALQMMTVGSKWRLTVPYALAYGEQGAGGVIGPFATLIFDIELLDIVS
ncbi:MAG: FKBP-type peptidyl-prolyl cis-trans isomerase FklB [Candidatus Azotimanducaceae bacterium]|jgi:FKBP-type peptidyl-prolyl cis-trans isomerase FklB|tara:strand:+ start:434 stop:1051 length:618 start_codon:yes stop_codon:yes gene_type:complete